jgi:uncharacterized pyridoxamine 5'-phosphate oxidase family protein
MTRTYEFLKNAGTFYLATMEGDQARVRPFGAVALHGGKLYICTNNKKKCFAQMMANPKVEISGMAKGEWIRVAGNARRDDSEAAREAMLEANPSLRKMYSPSDGLFEVLFLENAEATFCAFGKDPVTERF